MISFRLALLALFHSSLLVHLPVIAGNAVEWQQEPFEIRQMQGTQGTYSVQVKFNNPATDVVANVVPSLQPWITVNPVSYGNIQQGETLDIEINASIPELEKPGKHGGVIQLRAGKNQKNLSKPLNISLIITPKSGDGIPPDPGKAGKATLLGIDSDMDGVRDDIQRYIVLNYPDQPNMQNALFQLSRTYQRMLDPNLVEGTEVEIANQVGEDIDCLHYVAGSARAGSETFDKLEAEILNTYPRSVKYLLYDKKLSGEVFHLSRLPRNERYKLCDFEVR